jgi:hypothetical protein
MDLMNLFSYETRRPKRSAETGKGAATDIGNARIRAGSVQNLDFTGPIVYPDSIPRAGMVFRLPQRGSSSPSPGQRPGKVRPGSLPSGQRPNCSPGRRIGPLGRNKPCSSPRFPGRCPGLGEYLGLRPEVRRRADGAPREPISAKDGVLYALRSAARQSSSRRSVMSTWPESRA